MFKFNKYGVCLNPERETIHDEDGISIEISLSEKDSKWAYGYDLETRIPENIGGCCGSPSFGEYREQFESREAAREAALVFTRRWLVSERNRTLQHEITINRAIEATKQLTLF